MKTSNEDDNDDDPADEGSVYQEGVEDDRQDTTCSTVSVALSDATKSVTENHGNDDENKVQKQLFQDNCDCKDSDEEDSASLNEDDYVESEEDESEDDDSLSKGSRESAKASYRHSSIPEDIMISTRGNDLTDQENTDQTLNEGEEVNTLTSPCKSPLTASTKTTKVSKKSIGPSTDCNTPNAIQQCKEVRKKTKQST